MYPFRSTLYNRNRWGRFDKYPEILLAYMLCPHTGTEHAVLHTKAEEVDSSDWFSAQDC
jgi:hypothetical protein